MAIAVLAGAGVAAAEGPAPAPQETAAAEARRLYDLGAAAYEREDWKAAARAFSEADALAPNAVALATAIDAATLAGDARLAMTLSDRAAGRPSEARLDEAARAAATRFAGKTGRVRVTCPAACTAVVSGETIAAGAPARFLSGEHTLTIRLKDRPTDERRFTLGPDALLELAYAAPAGPAPAAGGLSPAWFFVGLGATALAGAALGASAADTASKHDAFVRAGCPGPVHGECTGAAAAGKDAELRTNVLIGVTGALAAATAVVGIGFVRWRAPRGGEVTVSAAGPGLSLRGAL